jgi:hypothetical protein
LFVNEDDGFAGAEDFVALGVGGSAALEIEFALLVFQFVEIAQVSAELISNRMNGLPFVVGARLRNLTGSVPLATACMYSTIFSQRTSFLSLPMWNPKYSSEVYTAAVEVTAKNRRAAIFRV